MKVDVLSDGQKQANAIKWNLYSGRGDIKSKNAFVGFMELINENGHELLSEYINNKTKALIDFNCGHESHWLKPNHYKRGVGCPKCSGLCSDQAKEEFLYLLRKNNHKLLSEYINNKTKVLIDFNCGHEPRLIKPNNYKSGSGCPKCSGLCSDQAKEEFLSLIKENGHIAGSEYINNSTKVLIDFNCGHEPRWTTPNAYKKGNRCSKCSRKCSDQAKEEFLDLIKENGHALMTEYKNNHSKVLIDYNCGHGAHWVKPNAYKSGNWCPKCKYSKGEKVILDYLVENKFNVVPQYKIDGHKYRYDLYIREFNLIVEVHGAQHYEDVVFFKNKTLKEEQMNDYKKEKLAVSKGYDYMVVDYREHRPKLALERFKKQFCFYINK